MDRERKKLTNTSVSDTSQLEEQLADAKREIVVLTQALAIRGGESGLEQGADLKSVLLYDLARSREEVASLGLELAHRTEKMRDLQKVVKELSFVREENNQELLKCEKRIHDLETRNAKLQRQVVSVVQEQQLLVDLQSRISSLITSQEETHHLLSAANHRVTDAERERAALSCTLTQTESQLKSQLELNGPLVAQVEKLQAENSALRQRGLAAGRAAAVQGAVGAQVAGIREQFVEAKAMYTRVESESAKLAQENARLLAVNADLRARCEVLEAENSLKQGQDSLKERSPSVSSPVLARASSPFTHLTPLSSPNITHSPPRSPVFSHHHSTPPSSPLLRTVKQ